MQNYNKYKTFPRDATLLIGSTITAMAAAIIAPALPQMNVVFHDTPNSVFLVKLSLSIHALAIALSAPFLGMLLDKWGRRPIVILSLILFGLSGASGYIARSLYMILAGRALLGVAMAGLMAGFTTLISDCFTGARLNKIMGLQSAFMAFGSVVFVTAAGFLVDYGWRSPFLIYLFGFLILPGVLLFVDEPEIQKRPKDESAMASLPIKKLLPVYLLGFLGMGIMFIIPLHVPFFLKTLRDMSGAKIGLGLGASMLFSGLASMQYQKVKSRLSFEKVFALLYLLMGAGLFIIATATSYFQVILGLAINGFGFGLLFPNANVLVVSMVSADVKGRAIGGLTTCILVSQFFSPILSQPIVGRLGTEVCFVVVGALGVVIAAAMMFGRLDSIARTNQSDRRPQQRKE